MEEKFNPYAAPTAEAPSPSMEAGVRRRPRSVKWATFVLGLCTAAIVFLYWQVAHVQGGEILWKHQRLFDLPLFMGLGFLFCLLGRRGRLSFFMVGIPLVWMLWRAIRRTLPKWTAVDAFAFHHLGERVGEFVFIFGVVYLTYRVVFGVPSLTYFGIAHQENELSAASMPKPNEH